MKFRVWAAIYIDYMIHFLKRKGKVDKEKIEQEYGSQVILQGLQDRFTEARIESGKTKEMKYIMTSRQEDKLICHIIVLLLMIN